MSDLPRICRRTRDALPLLLSDDLPASSDREARAHLADCPACRKELRAWLDLQAIWRASTGPRRVPEGAETPDAAWFAALERDVLTRVAQAPTKVPRRRAWPRVAAAAVVVLAGAIGARLALGTGAEPTERLENLLTRQPLVDSQPFVFDPYGPTRPVGQTFVGLRGRQEADRAVEAFLGSPVAVLRPLPYRER